MAFAERRVTRTCVVKPDMAQTYRQSSSALVSSVHCINVSYNGTHISPEAFSYSFVCVMILDHASPTGSCSTSVMRLVAALTDLGKFPASAMGNYGITVINEE